MDTKEFEFSGESPKSQRQFSPALQAMLVASTLHSFVGALIDQAI
jgi:hypothetical protein